MPRPAALEQRLGHRFTRPALLEQALTRGGPEKSNNERMEFLGDAVLDCVMAEEVYLRYPHLQEGGLHDLQVSLIRKSTLAAAARQIGLDGLLELTVTTVSESTLADTLEALFGAIFLDGGYAAAKKSILNVLSPFLGDQKLASTKKDSKTLLQEALQARYQILPTYRLLNTKGAAHKAVFEVECRIDKLKLVTLGTGTSRRNAEQQAAAAMLPLLKKT